ncbi:MAG: EF-hand domain-containing protein, partial [Brevundimonas sp.]
MRGLNLRTTAMVVSVVALLAACSGGPGGPVGPGLPFAPPPPPRASLFISPFGEPFSAPPGQPYPVAVWFAGADADHDGEVTLAEFTADGQRYFAVLDTDRDGRLNQTELAAYEALLREFGGMGRPRRREGPEGFPTISIPGPAGGGEIPLADTSTLGAAPQQSRSGSRIPRGGGRGPGGYGAVAEAGFFNLPQPVKSADINIDQRVTAEEWAQAT